MWFADRWMAWMARKNYSNRSGCIRVESWRLCSWIIWTTKRLSHHICTCFNCHCLPYTAQATTMGSICMLLAPFNLEPWLLPGALHHHKPHTSDTKDTSTSHVAITCFMTQWLLASRIILHHLMSALASVTREASGRELSGFCRDSYEPAHKDSSPSTVVVCASLPISDSSSRFLHCGFCSHCCSMAFRDSTRSPDSFSFIRLISIIIPKNSNTVDGYA